MPFGEATNQGKGTESSGEFSCRTKGPEDLKQHLIRTLVIITITYTRQHIKSNPFSDLANHYISFPNHAEFPHQPLCSSIATLWGKGASVGRGEITLKMNGATSNLILQGFCFFYLVHYSTLLKRAVMATEPVSLAQAWILA